MTPIRRFRCQLLTVTLICCCGFSAPFALAESPPLPPQTMTVIYSVNRTPEVPFDTARAVIVITADEIRRRNARTLPELLMSQVGVFVQQTNYGGGSPIIRGLIGKQILILVDGIRINNATYRFGPLQYLNTIDIESVERIEIVRGTDAVLTGYALGAVINVITKKGPAPGDKRPFKVAGSARFASANAGVTGRVEGSGRTDKFRYFVGGTYRRSDDLTAGGGIGRQVASGYDDSAANLSFDYFTSDTKTLSFRYLRADQYEVPRTDRVNNGSNLVFDFDPQRLQLATLVYSDLTSRQWLDSIQVTLSWNQQDEGCREIRAGAPSIERRLDDSQTTLGLGLELSTLLPGEHRLLYGLDYFAEGISSRRADLDLDTGETRAKRGRFTDDSSYQSLGAYLQAQFDVSERLALTLGGRYGMFKTSGRESSSVGDLDLDGTVDDFTGSASLVFKASKMLHVVGSVTRAIRGPNIDDVSVFDSRPEGTEVPNPGLLPERMHTYEIGLKHSSKALTGSATYYFSDLDNLIERSSGAYRGLPYFDTNENGIQDDDEPLVLQKQNIGAARIQGVELDVALQLASQWTLLGNYAYTKGEDTIANAPLSRIPPAFGTIRLRWLGSGQRTPWAEAVCDFAAAQRRVSARDASDDRIGPQGTDAFSVFHVRGGLVLGRNVLVSAAVDNIFDKAYKYHASGLLRPGRQVLLRTELQF